jgi:transcriptional regulator with XRE-family HTH domain
MSIRGECNGRLIRHYRKLKGWTQLQLATRSGLSERLVRKAENDGALRGDSLTLLAEALGSAAMPLRAQDLISDPLAIAQAYMRSYLKHGAESVRESAHLFAPDLVVAIHTDAANLAFAGEFRGIDGFEQMIRNAYSQFTPVNEDFGRWSVNGQRVVAMCQEVLQARGMPDAALLKTWILHEYTIADSVITRIDNYIDSIAWSRYLEQSQVDLELAARRDLDRPAINAAPASIR